MRKLFTHLRLISVCLRTPAPVAQLSTSN